MFIIIIIKLEEDKNGNFIHHNDHDNANKDCDDDVNVDDC